MIQDLRADLVLAIHPFSRGFGFALLEAPLSPIDWGVREVKGPNPEREYLAQAQSLIEQMQPDVVVLARLETSVLHRSKRRERFQRLLANYARGEGVRVVHYARVQVLACFEGVGAITRYQIAQAIAAQNFMPSPTGCRRRARSGRQTTRACSCSMPSRWHSPIIARP